MRQHGYTVSTITSKEYASFAQEHPLPSFLFGKEFSESDKIFLYNAYVKYIQETESPDLIIISIPGGLLPLSNTDSAWFGISAYEITRAVTPDTSLLITFFDNFKKQHIDETVSMFNSRFSLNINAIFMTNSMIEFSEDTYISYIPNEIIESSAMDVHNSTPIFNIRNTETMFSYIHDILAQFTPTTAF